MKVLMNPSQVQEQSPTARLDWKLCQTSEHHWQKIQHQVRSNAENVACLNCSTECRSVSPLLCFWRLCAVELHCWNAEPLFPVSIEEWWVRSEEAVRLVCRCLDLNSNIYSIMWVSNEHTLLWHLYTLCLETHIYTSCKHPLHPNMYWYVRTLVTFTLQGPPHHPAAVFDEGHWTNASQVIHVKLRV